MAPIINEYNKLEIKNVREKVLKLNIIIGIIIICAEILTDNIFLTFSKCTNFILSCTIL